MIILNLAGVLSTPDHIMETLLLILVQMVSYSEIFLGIFSPLKQIVVLSTFSIFLLDQYSQ
jgi:hypothetical protein